MDDFDRRLKGLLLNKYAGVAKGVMPEGYLEAPLAYDAIWAVALGELFISILPEGKIKEARKECRESLWKLLYSLTFGLYGVCIFIALSCGKSWPFFSFSQFQPQLR